MSKFRSSPCLNTNNSLAQIALINAEAQQFTRIIATTTGDRLAISNVVEALKFDSWGNGDGR